MESELLGAEQLKAALGKVSENVAKKHIRTALRAGAKVVAAQVIADAPVRSGATKDAVKVRAGKRSRAGVSMLVSIGASLFGGKTFYAGFVDRGWKWGSRKASAKRHYSETAVGTHRARIPGTRWLEKAFAKAKPAAQQVVLDKLTEGLQQEIESSGALK